MGQFKDKIRDWLFFDIYIDLNRASDSDEDIIIDIYCDFKDKYKYIL